MQLKGLILNLPSSEFVNLTTEAFVGMHNLRLLNLKYVHLNGDYRDLELRWLRLHGFWLKFLPASFHLENLVAWTCATVWPHTNLEVK